MLCPEADPDCAAAHISAIVYAIIILLSIAIAVLFICLINCPCSRKCALRFLFRRSPFRIRGRRRPPDHHWHSRPSARGSVAPWHPFSPLGTGRPVANAWDFDPELDAEDHPLYLVGTAV